MSVYLKDDLILLDSGNIATSQDCCCGGVCCQCDGTCDDTATKSECEANGYKWFSGAACDDDPAPCVTGACCNGNSCSIKTQQCCEDSAGTYKGDHTTCVPNPCPTGACCIGTVCSIQTETDCTGMGGTYQGDDTVCDPNPCPEFPPCCGNPFSAFDMSSRKFLTETIMASATQDSMDLIEHWEWNSTKITTRCPDSCICTGSGSATSPSFPSGCTFAANSCTPSCPDGLCRWPDGTSGCGWVATGGDCVGPFGISNQSACCPGACCANEIIISATEKQITFSCPDVGPCYAVIATITITLSNECTP